MHVDRLWLGDFRCYVEADVVLAPGVTVIDGANAQGKTSLLEAVAWSATGRSFRGVPDAVLVRSGCAQAIVRTEIVDEERVQLLEAEIRASGRNRVLLNKHPLQRSRDRQALVRVTVFAPDDLELVKGGPAGRRDYLDDLLVASAPRYEAARTDYERVLKQRNALLKSGLRGPDDGTTLVVFDHQLAVAGAELTRGRLRMLERLAPMVAGAYADLAGDARRVGSAYDAAWAGDLSTDPTVDADVTALAAALESALSARRDAELARGLTLSGPHRDEWRLTIGNLESRTHASQGEQRTLALALRLGGHRMLTEILDGPPVLLLDDVFSELDEHRAAALIANLERGQTLVTTAGHLPPGVQADRTLHVTAGVVSDAEPSSRPEAP